MEKISKESVQVYMHNMLQLRDAMESIGLNEAAVKAQESCEAARQYLLYLQEFETSAPKWIRWIIATRGMIF